MTGFDDPLPRDIRENTSTRIDRTARQRSRPGGTMEIGAPDDKEER
jgi:hypothetical protein